jgi:ubiquinone/menaquinone biosynthesis C-methylase UbiE
MPMKDQVREDVQEHYRKLAPQYNARANRTCENTYLRLLREHLPKSGGVLEIGCGSNDFLKQLGSNFAVGCDLSLEMILSSTQRSRCVVAAGEVLPFPEGYFDGLFLINVLEHVGSVEAVLEEAARVLKDGGVCVAITPNGNWEFWLDLAERWNLKLPEGPHRFLTVAALKSAVQKQFEIAEQRTFLLLPAGPPALASIVDQLTFCSLFAAGFFQFVVARKRRRGRGRV